MALHGKIKVKANCLPLVTMPGCDALQIVTHFQSLKTSHQC